MIMLWAGFHLRNLSARNGWVLLEDYVAGGGRHAFLLPCSYRYEEHVTKAVQWGKWLEHNKGKNGPVDLYSVSREKQHQLDRRVSGGWEGHLSAPLVRGRYRTSGCVHTHMCAPNKNSRTEQLPFFPCKAQVVCSCPRQQSLTLAFLICAAKFCLGPGNTALNQFRIFVSSNSSLCCQPWAGSWQEARAAVLWALLPVAMSGVSSKLGKMPLHLWIWAFCFFFV